MSNYTRDDMTNATGAVRSYIDNASEKEKTEKKGQQQWGLFETNYQRNKNITTHESLQEIEDFCKSGVHVNAGGEQWSIKGNPQGGGLEYATTQTHGGQGGGFGSSGAQGGQGGQGFGSNPNGQGGFGAAGQRGGAPGGGNLQFNDRTDAGAAFFAQHKATEAKKYQPNRQW